MKNIYIIVLIALTWSCNSDKSKPTDLRRDKENVSKLSVDTVGYSLKSIDDLHERRTINDYDKSLVEYVKSNPNKIDSQRKVVYLLPFGNMKPEVEKIIQSEVEYLEAFLQLEVKVLNKISYDSIRNMKSIVTRMVPDSDFEYYSKMKGGTPALREQIQARSFINTAIKKNMLKDAIAVLGITEHDIYNPEYNYLFGISGLRDGAGLVSVFRLIDYGPETKYNIRKVVSKQIVNMFSIPNVNDYDCVLNFHNSLEQLNRGQFDLSPRALEKLKHAIGFDYSTRFKALADFWRKENNIQETKYYEECLLRIKKTIH